MNELLLNLIWMNVINVMLSERSQTFYLYKLLQDIRKGEEGGWKEAQRHFWGADYMGVFTWKIY